jgi:N-formylglutamate deformylase
MNSHFDYTDVEFEAQLANCTLSPSLFNHEAHLRLAWIHLQKHKVEKAIEGVNKQILNYVDHLGVKDKFNKTLTIAAIRVVNHFMGKSKSDSFVDFMLEFPRLKTNFKDLISFHYGFDIYNSERAKSEYLAPDLVAFD